jgi:hypothetical protein
MNAAVCFPAMNHSFIAGEDAAAFVLKAHRIDSRR